MNEKIKNTLSKITPGELQKARMRSEIELEAARMNNTPNSHRRGSRVFRIAAAAAALCCVFCMTVFAEEIGGFFSGLFVNDEIVAESVQTGVYSDNDGHVNMAVEELLSDGAVVRMVVRYQAIDKQGKIWLDSLSYRNEASDIPIRYGLNAEPYFKDNNTVAYGASYRHNTFELEALRTEAERCFVVVMEADRFDWGTDNIALDYTMPSGACSTLLEISGNIQKRTVAIDAQAAPDKCYVPVKATVTPLSLIIEGEEFGYIETGYDDDSYYQRIVSDECVESLKLVFTDGKKIDILSPDDFHNGAWILCGGNQSAGENFIIIAGVSFKNPIDINTVAGFELDGIYYAFD